MTAYAWSYSPVRPPRSGQAVYEHNRSGSLSPIVLTDRHYARSPARRTGQHYQGFRVVQSATNQHSRSAHSISTFDQLIRSVQRMQSYVVAPPKVPNVHTHLRIGVPRNIVAPRHVRPTPSKPGVTAQPSPGIPAHIFGGAARTPRQPALSASLAAVT